MEIKYNTMTILNRLKLELNKKEYYTDEEYKTLLRENGLDGEVDYDKETHEVKLLNTVIAILETLSNDVDIMRKINSNEILTIDQAFKYLSQRIENIKARIINIEESKQENQGNINLIFFN